MIRALNKTDLPEILIIEKSVHIVPWTEETFQICFQSNYLGWVLEEDKTILGFIIVAAGIDECHVLNIGVARSHQHQGFGQQLLAYVLEHAKRLGISIVYLEVRRSNSRAISLYKKMKFHLIGERKNYYPTLSGQEDALIFVRSI